MLVSVCFGLGTYCMCKLFFDKQSHSSDSLENLKNALLTHALMKVKRDDIDNCCLDYASFDGTKLPMLSGCDIANACFSYIVNIKDFRKGPWYTPTMECKINAVHKYNNKNLDTDEKVYAFFNEYIDMLNKKHE